MWGKGGVQWSELLEVLRCIFLHSNANFKLLFNFVKLVVTNLMMVYHLWNKPMVSITTNELKYERGHFPLPSPSPPPPRYWSLMKFGPLVPMNTSRHFQLFWKRFASLFQNVFHVCTHKSFAYYQLHRNKSKYLDYISESFLRKGISWIVGYLTITCLLDTRVQFNELVWVFNLRVVPNIVYFFCLKIWEF